ncbi:cupin domain-containing protein [Chloroflexota bacterium]
MEILNIDQHIKFDNPNPEQRYMQEIITEKHNAGKLGGISVIIPPGGDVSYHYHKERESLIIIINGEATETVEGKEFPIRANDILFIPAGEKHGIKNSAEKELRFIEFFTNPPVMADRIDVNN